MYTYDCEQQTLRQIIINIVSYTRQTPTATNRLRPNTVEGIQYLAE